MVDSTSSPVATLLPFNAWPIYVAGLVVGTVPVITDEQTGYWFFISSIAFNFYAIFAVSSTLLFSIGKLPFLVGPRRGAIARVNAGGPLDAPDSQPLLIATDTSEPADYDGYQPALVDFLLPLGVLLGLNIIPVAMGWGGRSKIWSPFASSFAWGLVFGTIITLFLVPAIYYIVHDITCLVRRRRSET